jgi:hypothetical protein
MKWLWATLLSISLLGCIATYRDFPVDALARKPAPGTCTVMHFNVKRFDILDAGGYSKLNSMFRNAEICKKMVPVDSAPEKGLYVEIETKWKPMSLPALVFGYLSVSTLTILPAWSTQDGYYVNYHVYMDGMKKETYNYEITRKAGVWIVLLPLAWLNLITYDETDAFEATANQFFMDARQYLAVTE